ncbi:hypothetical protein FN846DRAFT_946080 [Sphaerosporella brunnea]|uniref:Uncharacterized protein n=1 Tax=Sphaerosporella brunnea TaxID=1250544 RepID=A0A5J5EZB8_9PEZI|nr:hypothetical protein FN846DRAFT_946080 [Sphaerosporella brunnea]
MPRILDLPNELLIQIIQALVVPGGNKNHSVFNLCIVNRRLSGLATVELHRQFSATSHRRNIYVREFLRLLDRQPDLANTVESAALLPKEVTSPHSRFFWKWVGSGYIGEDVSDEGSVKTETAPVVKLLGMLHNLQKLTVEINHLEELVRVSSSPPFPVLKSLTVAKALRDTRGAGWLPLGLILSILDATPKLRSLEIQGGGITTVGAMDYSHDHWSENHKNELEKLSANSTVKASLDELRFVNCNLHGEWLSWLLQAVAPSLKRFKYSSKVPYVFETMKHLVVALKAVRNTLSELIIDDDVGNDHTGPYGHGRAAGNLAEFTALKRLRASYRTLLNIDETITLSPHLETLEVTTIEEWGDVVVLLYQDMIAAVKSASLRQLRVSIRFIGDRTSMVGPTMAARASLERACKERGVQLDLTISGRPRPRHWPLVWGVNGFTFP